uniref:Uncharacterized protein n=1 Tax=Craspedostauros australis TaxID=1486917 RepID=A0A7R9WWB7_9STRA|mmetsp:Transcript_23443/g.65446  ORF Transcript_23443/g.65446 Transcript_23443/m.65446 type:complete len:154 (+) Transcript_23443:1028-1489(+)|eukprot:CAMPEP_0198133968 /NCGR_PEP_ID=MMETSP1442-20131203/59839_1 /TAXON_ID= /ORGANISM="Craspedostauros australis, Strain CCMP3328" /LENGTH=153 /DNA_ID=CAMNT_0043795103 /DNA_START=1561 /DNA_END=2022 /DNA_ORIENTATION=+
MALHDDDDHALFSVADGILLHIPQMFRNGRSECNGIFGLPMLAKEVTKEELQRSFPTDDVLTKWQKGERAEWPPMDDGPDDELPQLRFVPGQKVFCRIGPDATKDWAPGQVIQLWYREKNWPPGSFAPYKIKLDDGRQIFAPADMDQVIRKAA